MIRYRGTIGFVAGLLLGAGLVGAAWWYRASTVLAPGVEAVVWRDPQPQYPHEDTSKVGTLAVGTRVRVIGDSFDPSYDRTEVTRSEPARRLQVRVIEGPFANDLVAVDRVNLRPLPK